MKIKLLVARATALGAENRGAVIEVADAEAIRMIDAEPAVAVRDSAPERAVKPVKFERAAK